MTEEVSDAEIKQLEEELKKLEDKDTSYGSPTAAQKESLFKFYNKLLTIKDTTRIGNMTAKEIGLGRLSVRGNKSIALYAEAEGLSLVSEYFRDKANILTETSMSKKGFMSQLFFTQIKREKKDSNKTQDKKWFSSKKEEAE
ncbi:hypothetical protein LCGC14_1028970 [marine sediment metagenome]|uniref:Uncharacterized protein n=1 Tax=marine sediment metagenome TaxID=412755 RepID=A0A0F9R110_9ZZZZ